MSYQCHIHSCSTAQDRHLATRIATEVRRTTLEDADDFVDELIFRLSEEGLEDARVRTQGAAKEVVLEGRFIMRWQPADEERTAPAPNSALSLAAVRARYHLGYATIKDLQKRGVLPAHLSVRVMDAYMATRKPHTPRTEPAAAPALTNLPSAPPLPARSCMRVVPNAQPLGVGLTWPLREMPLPVLRDVTDALAVRAAKEVRLMHAPHAHLQPAGP